MKKTKQQKRPSWDAYFIGIVDSVSSRATCDRGGKGCVITINNRILSTGYLGSVSGLPHCSEAGHDIEKNGDSEYCKRTIHAEHNAITQALSFGIPLEGATMYCETSPCTACHKMIISLGIKKIITKGSKKK
ncbi:MAG TPA: deaminase [Candidatus Paceibacterota bacterium]